MAKKPEPNADRPTRDPALEATSEASRRTMSASATGAVTPEVTGERSGELSGEATAASAKVPRPAVGRLSLYFRELHRLHESGEQQINSADLGRLVNVSPAVVRRDISSLGTIGRRGVGYSIPVLIDRIGMMLGTGVNWRVILVGVGSLGSALLKYRGFERLGFEMMAAYDIQADRIGQTIGGVDVRIASQMTSDLSLLKPDLAILAVPAEKALEVAQSLCKGGVEGILNFAPTTLRLPGDVAVVNVDLASELQRLAFSVQRKNG